MASSADGVGVSPAPRDLVDVVDDLLPGWRAHRPRRTLAAGWSTRAVSIGGRQVEVFSLPGVGVTWLLRTGPYWRRRVGFVVSLTVAILVFLAVDVGVLSAAASSSASALSAVVLVLVLLFLATSLLYWRSDLFVRRGVEGVRPLPGPVKACGVLFGGLGMITTPAYVLGLLLDQTPRFPVQERAAWEFAVAQLAGGSARS